MSTDQSGYGTKTVDSSANPSEPKGLVQRFKVCWGTLPDYYYVKGKRRQIGFLLELSGTHEPGIGQPQPGPKERRDSTHDIVPHDQAIHYDPSRKFRPEVTLQIWIRHRSGFDREVDACEVRCPQEMTQRLKELGAQEGNWEALCA